MIVKIEKISDTEYAKYSDCPNAYYAEVKYERDRSSFAGIAFQINDDKTLSFDYREEVMIKAVNKYERLYYGMEGSYCNSVREIYEASNAGKGLKILFLVYSDVRSCQAVFEELSVYICDKLSVNGSCCV